QRRGPWGLAGGEPGAPGSARVREAGSRGDRRLRAPFSIDLTAGGELELETPGGGGFGALRRAPDAHR
ncbi:MAG: hydantoinase B/oxoprolinase family protein, partial [Planctomycetes bacterium]|nr:hydantoinase B/oxoprolinase family protein [Planctomycetota bacterium]